MQRFTALSRPFGFVAFALMLALGLFAPHAASAAAPPPGGWPVFQEYNGPAINPGIFIASEIYNVKLVTYTYTNNISTAVITFDTSQSAEVSATWGTQCLNNVCEFPLPGGFNGYDAKGYSVQYPVGTAVDAPFATPTHHTIVLKGLTPDTGYDYLLAVNLADDHVHTFYGRFWTKPLGA